MVIFMRTLHVPATDLTQLLRKLAASFAQAARCTSPSRSRRATSRASGLVEDEEADAAAAQEALAQRPAPALTAS